MVEGFPTHSRTTQLRPSGVSSLAGPGIADSRKSFVAGLRQCDESAALTTLGNAATHCCQCGRQHGQKSGNYDSFFQAFCGVLSRTVILCALHVERVSYILLQRGIAILDCEAAALPGRFLPELGRSSERPFFCAGLLRREFVARSLMGFKPTSHPRSCSRHKIPRAKGALPGCRRETQ